MGRYVILVAVLIAFAAIPAAAQTTTQTTVYLPSVMQATGSVVIRSEHGTFEGTTYTIRGEIENDTITSVKGIVVTVRWYDRNNNVVLTSETYPHFYYTDSGQRNPFIFTLDDTPLEITHYVLSIRWSKATGTHVLTLLSQQRDTQYGFPIITGTIRNDLGHDVVYSAVVATFYDVSGRMVDVRSGYASPSNLTPGDSADYTITYDSDIVFDSFTVEAREN